MRCGCGSWDVKPSLGLSSSEKWVFPFSSWWWSCGDVKSFIGFSCILIQWVADFFNFIWIHSHKIDCLSPSLCDSIPIRNRVHASPDPSFPSLFIHYLSHPTFLRLSNFSVSNTSLPSCYWSSASSFFRTPKTFTDEWWMVLFLKIILLSKKWSCSEMKKKCLHDTNVYR